MKIAKIENDSWEKEKREKAGLLDIETGRSELILGWTTIKDFGDAQVLERLLMYEKRIESSLYKAMNELQKLQRIRKEEQTNVGAGPCACPERPYGVAPTDQTVEMKKQSQFPSYCVLRDVYCENKLCKTNPITGL